MSSPGTRSQNTQCQPCPPGTFSASSSSSEQCQAHRNCTALGLVLNVPGSSSHDALCTSCTGFPLSTVAPGGPGEWGEGARGAGRGQPWSTKHLAGLWGGTSDRSVVSALAGDALLPLGETESQGV